MTTKTSTAKRALAVATALSIILCAFCVFTAIPAAAATDNVKLYSADTYFCKYGITGTNVFVQTKDNAKNQKVYVHYNHLKGEAWQDSEATYVTTLNDGSKLWKAYISSYNTEYVIKYVADGRTYWDNNNDKNYTSERIGSAPVTVNRSGYVYLPYFNVSATLQNYAYVKDVKVRYTVNNWASFKDIPMTYSNTNADGTENWTAVIKENKTDTTGFHYCVSYKVNGKTYWANNFGMNYDASYRVYP